MADTTPPPALEGVAEELRGLLEKAREPLRDRAPSADLTLLLWVKENGPALLSALAGMRSMLTKAAEQFEFYAREHWTKVRGAEFSGMRANADAAREKALTNERMAKLCRAALAVQGQGKTDG